MDTLSTVERNIRSGRRWDLFVLVALVMGSLVSAGAIKTVDAQAKAAQVVVEAKKELAIAPPTAPRGPRGPVIQKPGTQFAMLPPTAPRGPRRPIKGPLGTA